MTAIDSSASEALRRPTDAEAPGSSMVSARRKARRRSSGRNTAKGFPMTWQLRSLEQRCGGIVGVDDDAVLVEGEDAVAGVVEQLAKELTLRGRRGHSCSRTSIMTIEPCGSWSPFTSGANRTWT